ncbi:MAG TPA: NFACT RNA binding domain-containing protein [Gemmatimonadaceae bacterium]|nr:NFACT RNA binding domain-containing protein [Gemmatimonadaceae bacterium]
MDSLTARHLARELDERWRGRRLDGCRFDRDARAVSLMVDGRTVRFDLAQPDVLVTQAEPLERASGPLHGWSIDAVRAPTDDRRLVITLVRPGRFKGSAERRADLVVSAVPRARGALLRDAGGAKIAAVGAELPPLVEPRPVLSDSALAAAVHAGDAAALLAGRWMSPFIVRWMIANPDRATERYHAMCSDAPAAPARCGPHLLPFPFCANAVPAGSLIDVAESTADETGAPVSVDARHQRAIDRMRVELERAHDAPLVRAAADALVALGDAAVPASVRLPGGAEWPVSSRPGERASDVAARLYAEARSKERALASLPGRLAAARAAPAGVRPVPLGGKSRGGSPARAAPKVPYRTYRSSGGLEIWVGRGAASNDALTFDAAAPNDVWLHARDAAGAHVVLRWTAADAPPARDLRDAAILAAWHSKSRGASMVPVDWTRRKHVRKPRGARPGAVVIREERTLMVRPSATVERALRDPR